MHKQVTGLDDDNTDSLGSNTGEDNSSDNIFISSLSTAEGKLYHGGGKSFIIRKCYLSMPMYSS